MTPPINRQELVMGRMGLNVLSGMSGGAIFLLLLAELIRQQHRNERNKGWGR